MMSPAIILLLAALSAAPKIDLSPQLQKTEAPPIAEVQRRAIEHARINPAEISSWKKRVRYSALLPKLQLEYQRRLENYVNVNVNDSVYVGSGGSTVGPNDNSYTENANNNQNFGVKAVWDFSEAVFNPDMLAVSEETRLLARERQSILAEVNRNYYERERVTGEISFLQSELKRNPRDQKIRQEIFSKQIAFNEASAALDALTGGWFGEQLRVIENRGGLR